MVDDNFEVSIPHIYIDNPIFSIKREVYPIKNNTSNNIRNMFKMMKENYTIINNTFYIKIPRLELGEDVVYNYTVKSNKSGIFCIDTLFRLDDSKWPDSLREDTIEIRPPEIEVDILEDQLFAIRDEPLNITFNILHRSGWCNDVTAISMFFNQSDNYDILIKEENDNYKKYDGGYIKLNLTPLEATSYKIQIKYHNAGKHHVPRLNAAGATVKQQDVDIDVVPNEETKDLQDYGPLYTSIVALISIIFAAIEIRIQQRELNKQQEEINTQQGEIHKIELHIKQIIEMQYGINPQKKELDDNTYIVYDELTEP
jgi:hypothetical protein